MKKRKKDGPWWLESGHEYCSSCGHTFLYEMGYYCISCDGALCSICVETGVSAIVLCTWCADSERGESIDERASDMESQAQV